MNITKRHLPCNCINTNCQHFKWCCFTSTEMDYVDGTDKIHIMFVGQGAGKSEDINITPTNTNRYPFFGRAGTYLRHMVKELWDKGMSFNVAFSNNVRFHPMGSDGKDRKPTQEEISKCIHHLERDIEYLKPKTVIPVGENAAVSLVPGWAGLSMKWLNGKLYNGIYRIIPMYHPSFLCRTYGSYKIDQEGEFHIKCMEVLKKAVELSTQEQ